MKYLASMPKEMGEKWVKALRNGDYEQGFGRLREKTGGYCCIGVWCVANHVSISGDGCSMNEESTTNYRAFTSVITPTIKDDPAAAGDVARILVNMNDNDEKSFTEIADWIEKNIEFK